MKYFLYIILYTAGVYALLSLIAYLLQDRLIFYPVVDAEDHDYDLATEHEEIKIETDNKGLINGLLLKVPDPKGLVFYLHGNAGSLKRWRFMAEEITTYGYDVYVMDYRGYGKSKGKRREDFMHRDVEMCFDYISTSYSNKQIIIWGRSLGTGFAASLASKRDASKLILETPFYNLLDAGQNNFPFLPLRWLLKYEFPSDKHIVEVNYPIEFIHGTKDKIVPIQSGLKLYKKVEHRPDVQFTTIQGGKHNNLNAYPLYRERLKEFLE